MGIWSLGLKFFSWYLLLTTLVLSWELIKMWRSLTIGRIPSPLLSGLGWGERNKEVELLSVHPVQIGFSDWMQDLE